jgi:hypothetical protein
MRRHLSNSELTAIEKQQKNILPSLADRTPLNFIQNFNLNNKRHTAYNFICPFGKNQIRNAEVCMKIKKGIQKSLIGMFALLWVMVFYLTGCQSFQAAKQTTRNDIQSPDPVLRVKSIVQAGRINDKQAIPLIVDRLDDEDEAVRLAAIETLQKMIGNDFGYKPYDTVDKRKEAVEKFRGWMKTQTN